MPDRAASATLYEHFARIGKAVASPSRVRLLDLLAQGERGVDALAHASGLSLTNASQHLQALRAARLVETRREGTKIIYRLAGDDVYHFLSTLRDLARARLAEVEQVVRDSLERRAGLEPVTRAELLARAELGDVVVLDVRPGEEYEAGHVPGALSVPLERLEQRLAGLPEGAEIVAYCRGPFCLLASEAVELLRAHGFPARRLEDGFPEWRLAGLPVATGVEAAT